MNIKKWYAVVLLLVMGKVSAAVEFPVIVTARKSRSWTVIKLVISW